MTNKFIGERDLDLDFLLHICTKKPGWNSRRNAPVFAEMESGCRVALIPAWLWQPLKRGPSWCENIVQKFPDRRAQIAAEIAATERKEQAKAL